MHDEVQFSHIFFFGGGGGGVVKASPLTVDAAGMKGDLSAGFRLPTPL